MSHCKGQGALDPQRAPAERPRQLPGPARDFQDSPAVQELPVAPARQNQLSLARRAGPVRVADLTIRPGESTLRIRLQILQTPRRPRAAQPEL